MQTWIILITILSLLIIISMIRWIKRFRYRTAFKMGKIEHKISRYVFLAILITLLLNYLKMYEVALITNLVAAILWLIYWVAHSLEKWFFPTQRKKKSVFTKLVTSTIILTTLIIIIPKTFGAEPFGISWQGRIIGMGTPGTLQIQINDSDNQDLIFNETYPTGIRILGTGTTGFDEVTYSNNFVYGTNYTACFYINGTYTNGTKFDKTKLTCQPYISPIGVINETFLNLSQQFFDSNINNDTIIRATNTSWITTSTGTYLVNDSSARLNNLSVAGNITTTKIIFPNSNVSLMEGTLNYVWLRNVDNTSNQGLRVDILYATTAVEVAPDGKLIIGYYPYTDKFLMWNTSSNYLEYQTNSSNLGHRFRGNVTLLDFVCLNNECWNNWEGLVQNNENNPTNSTIIITESQISNLRNYMLNGSRGDINNGWVNSGWSWVGGDIYVQTLYAYNISKLDVYNLSINGSLLPPPGYDNVFDIGSSALRWKDIFFSGKIVGDGSSLTGMTTNATIVITQSQISDLDTTRKWNINTTWLINNTNNLTINETTIQNRVLTYENNPTNATISITENNPTNATIYIPYAQITNFAAGVILNENNPTNATINFPPSVTNATITITQSQISDLDTSRKWPINQTWLINNSNNLTINESTIQNRVLTYENNPTNATISITENNPTNATIKHGSWVAGAQTIYNNTAGVKVGIGTSTPNAKLETYLSSSVSNIFAGNFTALNTEGVVEGSCATWYNCNQWNGDSPSCEVNTPFCVYNSGPATCDSAGACETYGKTTCEANPDYCTWTPSGTYGNATGLYISSAVQGNGSAWGLYDTSPLSYFAGKVGIGTTTPTNLLTIGADKINMSNSGDINASNLKLGNNLSVSGKAQIGDSLTLSSYGTTAYINSTSTGSFVLWHDGGQKMVWDTWNNVYVNSVQLTRASILLSISRVIWGYGGYETGNLLFTLGGTTGGMGLLGRLSVGNSTTPTTGAMLQVTGSTNITGDLFVNESTFFVNGTTHNIGIITRNPTHQLSINTSINMSKAGNINVSDDLKIGNAFIVDVAGLNAAVGIGTASPTANVALDVRGNELAVSDGTYTNTYAQGAGALYVEYILETDDDVLLGDNPDDDTIIYDDALNMPNLAMVFPDYSKQFVCYDTASFDISYSDSTTCYTLGVSPFFQLWTGNNLTEEIEYLANLRSKTQEGYQSFNLINWDTSKFRVTIEERKKETSYTDQLQIVLIGTDVANQSGHLSYYVLQPNLQSLKTVDDNYLTLVNGQRVNITFDPIPNKFLVVGAYLRVYGYYVLDAEPDYSLFSIDLTSEVINTDEGTKTYNYHVSNSSFSTDIEFTLGASNLCANAMTKQECVQILDSYAATYLKTKLKQFFEVKRNPLKEVTTK